MSQGIEYAVIIPSLWHYLEGFGEQQWFLGLTLSIYSVATAISSPIYGIYVDRGGSKKRTLLVSNIFEIVGNAIYFIAIDGYCVLGARFIAGLGGGAGSAMMAYIGDITTEQDRSSAMGMVMAARQGGLLVGPALNFLFARFNTRFGPFHLSPESAPGLAMVLVWLVAQLVIYRYLPALRKDTAVQDSPETAKAGDINADLPGDETRPLITIPGPTHDGGLVGRGQVVIYLMSFVVIFNQLVLETIITPLVSNLFGWGPTQTSVLFSCVAIEALIAFGVLNYLHRLGLSDRVTLLIGTLFELAALIWLAVFCQDSRTRNDALLWKVLMGIAILVAGLPFIFVPLPSLISKLVGRQVQGTAQGLRRAFLSAGAIAGPLFAGALFGDMTLLTLSLVSLISVMILVLLLSFPALKRPSYSAPRREDTVVSPE